MNEISNASLVAVVSAVLSSIAATSPFIWRFSSWKQQTEDRITSSENKIKAIEALDISVQLATIFTILKHVEQSQVRIENALLNNK